MAQVTGAPRLHRPGQLLPRRPGQQQAGCVARARRPALRVQATSKEEQERERRRRMVADTSDEDAYLPSDIDSDIPMSQRLGARDLFRQMAHLPPEYASEAEEDNPDKHRQVADMASDSDDMLPDDPLDMDEELITDTKPFITDLYDETAGTRPRSRHVIKAQPAPASTAAGAAAAAEGSPKYSPNGSGGRGASNMPPGKASRMSVGGGDKREPGGGEARMEAAEEVTDMKRGPGVQQREGEAEVAQAEAKYPGDDRTARRRAIEKMGGRDRPLPGQSLFLDKREESAAGDEGGSGSRNA